MLAICQYIMFIEVVKNVAGYHVFLNFAANTSEGDRSIVAGLELLTLFFCLFDFILYVHSTIFQLCGTGLPGLNQY